MQDDGQNDLFVYTSGRFMFNEKLRLKERRVVFNVDALKREVEKVFNFQHGRVFTVSKLAEGGFNRVLLLQMEDGFEAIVKIPYRIAIPAHFATASEVATLEFLRLKDVPVPKVYGYSTEKNNTVGAEYVIMQKAPGTNLAAKWLNMSTAQIKRLAYSFMEIEKRVFDLPFSSTGSIYFKSDLPAHLQAPLYSSGGDEEESKRFCIGPVADYMFWYGKRAGMPLDRGPWKNPVKYLCSTADKEIEWIKLYGKDREPDFPYCTTGIGQQSATSYVALLENFKKLAPHLLPEDHTCPIAKPTLRHPDLTAGNIFVSPETDRVACLVDWQHTVVQPRLLVAGYPRAFENPEDELPNELVEPSLPADLETLPPEMRAQAEESYRREAMFYYYRVFNGHFNQPHIAVLRDPLLQLRQHLVDRAGRQWNGNPITLKGALIRITQFWKHLPDVDGIECPVEFEKKEVDEFLVKEQKWLEMSFAEENWRQQVCFMNEHGWVPNEDFEEAKMKLKELTDKVWSLCDEEDRAWFLAGWPFKDHEEVD